MNIDIREKQKTFLELTQGAIFKLREDGELSDDGLYMKILVIDKDGEDSYMALSLKDARTYKIDGDLVVTEFKNSTFTITIEY